MKKETTKTGRGGSRKGSGQKKLPIAKRKKSIFISLKNEEIYFLGGEDMVKKRLMDLINRDLVDQGFEVWQEKRLPQSLTV